MLKVLISNIGFGEASPEALEAIQKEAHVIENKEKCRFTERDFIEKIHDANILIAGTETITKAVIDSAPHLKLIARVGVGVDNIDLEYARERNINISYTPEAPSEAVPEFTLSLILNLLKGISISDSRMHQRIWHRPVGRMLSSMKFGIVGVGKIGAKVIQLIKAIAPSAEIFFYDPFVASVPNATKCDLEVLFKQSDVISLHLPLSSKTNKLINLEILGYMKKESYIVNTSRGGILDERALYQMLKVGHLAGAAIDVFEVEPYEGPLTELKNCLLTSHMGSMTQEVRASMEQQVAEDVVCFIKNKPLCRPLEGFNFTGW